MRASSRNFVMAALCCTDFSIYPTKFVTSFTQSGKRLAGINTHENRTERITSELFFFGPGLASWQH